MADEIKRGAKVKRVLSFLLKNMKAVYATDINKWFP